VLPNNGRSVTLPDVRSPMIISDEKKGRKLNADYILMPTHMSEKVLNEVEEKRDTRTKDYNILPKLEGERGSVKPIEKKRLIDDYSRLPISKNK